MGLAKMLVAIVSLNRSASGIMVQKNKVLNKKL